MLEDTTILMAEDDEGHTGLIKRNLRRAGINNKIQHFADGQKLMDFLFDADGELKIPKEKTYLLLLDIRMPVMDGIEALKKIKGCPQLKSMPIFMFTTAENPGEVNICHDLGCSGYITKPVAYDEFTETCEKLASFLKVLKVPELAEA